MLFIVEVVLAALDNGVRVHQTERDHDHHELGPPVLHIVRSADAVIVAICEIHGVEVVAIKKMDWGLSLGG